MRNDIGRLAADFFETVAPLSSLRPFLESDDFDRAGWRRYCSELEGGRLLLGAAHGGSEGTLADAAGVAEAAGRVLFGGPYVQQWLAGMLMEDVASAAGVLEELANGEVVTAIVLDSGRVRATRTETGWLLDVKALPVEFLAVCDRLLVAASGVDGEGLFLLESADLLDAPSGARGGVQPLRALDLTRSARVMTLTGTPAECLSVPSAELSARLGRVRQANTLLRSAENLGSLQRLHEITTAYALQREQFGRPIAAFQGVKHELADLFVDAQAAAAAVDLAVFASQSDPTSPATQTAVLAASLLVDDAFAALAQAGVQLHGGIGFTWEHDAHLFFRRAGATRHVGGTRSQRLRRLVEAAPVTVTSAGPSAESGAGESSELAAFRARARAWLEESVAQGTAPATRPGPGGASAEGIGEAKRHQLRLLAEGFAGITYPVQYGGAGLGPEFEDAFFEETRACGAGEDKLFRIGVGMIGPAILAMGSEEQRQRFLPPLIRGEELWCELFSEPGSGSDMAGAQTRAVLEGDEYVVTGQKVWTSNGHLCDFGVLLARTDTSAPKHAGLSMFLVPMDAAGIEVRPLRQMTGSTDFNEVFLDRVRIPRTALIGAEGDGWKVARLILQHERKAMASSAVKRVSLEDLRGLLAAEEHDSFAEVRLAEQVLREHAVRTYSEHLAAGGSGRPVPAEGGAVIKLLTTRSMQSAASLAVEFLGHRAVAWEAQDDVGDLLDRALAAQAFSIAGGTDNILRNLIGERTLGLPRD